MGSGEIGHEEQIRSEEFVHNDLNRMGSEEFVVMDTQWEEIKTKTIRDSKILEKKFSYLVSEIFLQTNDCLAPEGDQKDK